MGECMTNGVKSAIQRFLNIFQAGPEVGSVTPIDDLVCSLDLLAYLAHDVQCEFDDTVYPEPPVRDARMTYALSMKWFPYDANKADSIDPYAVMDLSEVADDLMDTAWRFENTSESDALWHYQFEFRSHWGHHLRSLQKAIHEWYW